MGALREASPRVSRNLEGLPRLARNTKSARPDMQQKLCKGRIYRALMLEKELERLVPSNGTGGLCDGES